MMSDDPQSQASSRFKIFSYTGRIGRLKYLVASLVVGVVSAVVGILVFIFSFALLFSALLTRSFGLFWIILGIFLSVAVVPSVLASTFIVRRFHDLGKSGKWWFALLIPIYDIHLAIGLLTERGTVGPNQYGEDPLPPDAPSNDIVHRFSQNKALRVVALIVITFLSLAGSVENSLQQRTQQQAFNQTLTQSINTEEDKQYQIIHEHLSQLNLAEGTSTETQKVDTSHWKSEMVTVPSRSACYTVSYPPQLNAPTSTPDVLGGMHTVFTITASSAAPLLLSEDTEPLIFIATVNSATSLYDDLDSAISDQLAYLSTQNITPQVKDFPMPNGFKAKEMFYPDGDWNIYLEIPGKTQNIVVELTPSYDLGFSLNVAEAIVRSIQLCN